MNDKARIILLEALLSQAIISAEFLYCPLDLAMEDCPNIDDAAGMRKCWERAKNAEHLWKECYLPEKFGTVSFSDDD